MEEEEEGGGGGDGLRLLNLCFLTMDPSSCRQVRRLGNIKSLPLIKSVRLGTKGLFPW